MKIKKVYEYNEATDIDDDTIIQLLEDLKFHYEQNINIDKRLRDICWSKIEDLMKNHKFEEAKKFVNTFYREYEDFTIERDFILMKINKELAFKKDAEKYNL